MRLLIAAACLAALAACNEQKPAADQAREDASAWLDRELGWVRNADPAEWAAQDNLQKKHRFMSVCSLGCAVVGIGELGVRMCYADVPVEVMDKTTEAVQSDDHAALKARARAFAESYNRHALENVKASGAGTCPPAADWDGAYARVNGILDQVYSSGFRGDVSVSEQRRVFQVRLPRGATVQAVQASLCAIVEGHGLKDIAGIEAKSVDTQDDYAPLAC